jgi:Tfp pilus assembly protein PilF
VYQAQGEIELARQMFEKAIQLSPDWQSPQENLLKLTEE